MKTSVYLLFVLVFSFISIAQDKNKHEDKFIEEPKTLSELKKWDDKVRAAIIATEVLNTIINYDKEPSENGRVEIEVRIDFLRPLVPKYISKVYLNNLRTKILANQDRENSKKTLKELKIKLEKELDEVRKKIKSYDKDKKDSPNTEDESHF